MAPVILFAFGPDDSFLFYCPRKIIYHRTNWAFSKTVPPKLNIPYSVALGPADNEYCALYISKTNDLYHSINVLTSTHLNPAVSFLVSHFKAHPQDILRSHLVLGPGNTYIAITPSGILWNVPESLRKMAAGRGYGLKGSENPNNDSIIANAALGQGGAWWVKFRDGSVMWDLAGGYVELQLLLKENTAVHNNINYLALSPFSDQHYFLDYEDNKVRYSLPAGYARLIGPEIDEYHASRVTVSGAHLAIGGASERDADSAVHQSEPPPYSAPKA